MGVGCQRQAPIALLPGNETRLPIVQEVGWAPGLVWTDAENLAPTGSVPRTVRPIASPYTE